MKFQFGSLGLLGTGAVLAGLLGLAVPAGAQQADWDTVVEAARKEGAVTIFSTQGLDQLNAFVKLVKDEYGIDVTVVRGTPADLQPKIDADFATGQRFADIYVTSVLDDVAKLGAEGKTLPLVGPAFDDPQYDRALRVTDGHVFEAGGSILTFGWNTESFPQGMKDYPDALDASGEGVIGVTIPGSSSQIDFWLFLEEQYGKDFIEKLAVLKPRLYPSALPMTQALMSGEIDIALGTRSLDAEKAKGIPVDSGLAPSSWGVRFYGVALEGSKNPNAGQVVANYMITRAGQEAVVRAGAAVFPDVPGTLADTRTIRNVDFSSMTPEFIADFQKRWKALFQN